MGSERSGTRARRAIMLRSAAIPPSSMPLSFLRSLSPAVVAVLLLRCGGARASVRGPETARSEEIEDTKERIRKMMANATSSFPVNAEMAGWFGGGGVIDGSGKAAGQQQRRMHDSTGSGFLPCPEEAAAEPCGSVLLRFTREEVLAMALAIAPQSEEFDNLIQYGAEVRKICASCKETMTQEEAAGGYCDEGAYGYDATVSGLLILPTDPETGKTVRPGALKSALWSRGTTAEPCGVPSIQLMTDSDAIIAIIMSSNGNVGIAPDNMGFGESYDHFKGYIHKKQYQTSFMPLWLEAKKLVARETNCESEVSNDIVLSGYSEGGYAAVAIAEALESYGANIIKLQGGAGPYKLSSAQFTVGYRNLLDGLFPENNRFYMLLLGQAYSSTYEGLENYGEGQDLMADSWTVTDASTGIESVYVKDDAVHATTGLAGAAGMNEMLQAPLSISTLDAWNPNVVEFLARAEADGVIEPCKNEALLAEWAAAGKNVNKLCEVLLANDLTEYMKGITYPYELCHSFDDEIVPVQNVIENDDFEYYAVSGNHVQAGSMCTFRFLTFFNTPEFTSVSPVPSGTCNPGLPTASPASAPTASPALAPTASPALAPTTSPASAPTASPASAPTASPALAPTTSPASAPTASPASDPSSALYIRPVILYTFLAITCMTYAVF